MPFSVPRRWCRLIPAGAAHILLALLFAPLAGVLVACIRFYFAVADGGTLSEYATIALVAALVAYVSTLFVAVPLFVLFDAIRRPGATALMLFVLGGVGTGLVAGGFVSPGFPAKLPQLLIGAVSGGVTALLFHLIATRRRL